MWFIIICAALGFVLAFADSYGDIVDAIFGLIVGAIVGACIALVGSAFYSTEVTEHKTKTVLQNLVDNTHTEGSFSGGFFIMSGSIDGVPHYSWYEKTGKNSYERRDVEASLGTVHYLKDSKTKPYLELTWYDHKRRDGSWLQPWGYNIASEYWVEGSYDFYIPRGSITNEFKLDAK
jgi:hypothetical protein